MLQGDDLTDKVRSWYRAAMDAQKDWRSEAKTCYDFYAGHQWSQEEMAEMEEHLRPMATMNRIQPMVSSVVGQQINNRQEVRYLPRELGDVQVSEILTGAAQWVDDECDAEDEITEVFTDLLITGMGWSETRISYDEDIDGKIHSAERVSPMEMFWDATSKRKNLADAKYVMRARWINRKDAEAKWPNLKNVEIGPDEFFNPDEEADRNPHDATRAAWYVNDQREWYNEHKDEIFIVQVQWWEHTPMYRVGDPASGRLLELSDTKFNRLKPQLDMMGIQYVRQLQKRFYQAFIAGPVVLESGDCPCSESFTLRAVTGKRDAVKNTWFGLVRGMVDPQKWSNKFFSDIQDMIMSNRQGGAFVEETALVDPRNAEEVWNEPNPLILVKDGALGRGAIQERSPAPYPQGMDRMMEWAVQSLPSVTGINFEMMGSAGRDQPNVLELQRKKSALAVLADVFDSMRRFQKERGRVVLHFIQTYINDGRLIRITGQNGKEQFVPLALNPEETKYDVIVDEASTSPNQKQETFLVMSQLLPILTQMGMMPPPDLIEYMPLPSSLIESWKATMQPEEPPPPDPLMMAQLELIQAEIQSKQAEVQAKQAKAARDQKETEAQEIENMAVMQGIMAPEDL